MDQELKEIRELKRDVNDLTRKIERLESLIDSIYRELGAREGAQLADQVNHIERNLEALKPEIDRIKVDTTQIKRVQEFGSRDMDDIKKALAAIYRNTDELEKTMLAEDRTTI